MRSPSLKSVIAGLRTTSGLAAIVLNACFVLRNTLCVFYQVTAVSSYRARSNRTMSLSSVTFRQFFKRFAGAMRHEFEEVAMKLLSDSSLKDKRNAKQTYTAVDFVAGGHPH